MEAQSERLFFIGRGGAKLAARLDRTMEDRLTLAALRLALARRRLSPRLVHHSDRGVQYASTDYTALLAGPWHSDQHVAQSQPLGQRRLRVVYEDAEV